MDALSLLGDEAALADGLMDQVLGGVTNEQAVWRPEGGTNNPIASIAVHIYFSQDRLIQRLQGRPTVAEAGGWGQRLGLTPSAIWTPLSNPDLNTIRGYITEVRAATDDFLQHLDPGRLGTEEVDLPIGRRSLASALALILVVHKSAHLGEISALVGAQGGKGFPF